MCCEDVEAAICVRNHCFEFGTASGLERATRGKWGRRRVALDDRHETIDLTRVATLRTGRPEQT